MQRNTTESKKNQYVILLARRSTNQGQDESIDSQVKFCTDFFPQYKPDKVFRITETGVSNEKGRDKFRDQYLRHVADKLKEGFKVITIAYSGSRYTRNFEDFDYMIRLFRKGAIFYARDCKLEQMHDIIPFACAVGVSNTEYFGSQDAMKRGRVDAIEKGKFILGRTPTGYVDTKVKGVKAIDPIQGPVIRKIFELFATGKYSLLSFRPIAEEMGEKVGIKFGTAEKLRKILRKEFYTGFIVYKGAKFKSLSPALIEYDLFKRVDQILSGRAPKREKRHRFLFSGRIRLPDGRALIGDIKKGKYVYYRDKYLGFKSVKQEHILEALRTYIEHVAKNADIAAVKATLQKHIDDSFNARAEERKAMNLRMSGVEQKIRTLTQMRMNDELTADEYMGLKVEYVNERNALLEQSSSFENEKFETMMKGADRLVELLNLMATSLESHPLEIQEQIIDLVGSNFLYDGKNVDIKPTILMYSIQIFEKNALAVPSEMWVELSKHTAGELERLLGLANNLLEYFKKCHLTKR